LKYILDWNHLCTASLVKYADDSFNDQGNSKKPEKKKSATDFTLGESSSVLCAFRLVKHGHLPYVNAHEQLPEEMKLSGNDALLFHVEVSLPPRRYFTLNVSSVHV